MTQPLDPELAVALDVLLERYSPPRPYRYEWVVWRLEGRLMATLSAGKPHLEAWWSLPPLGDDWGAADRLHVTLEAEAWRRLFEAYEAWRDVQIRGFWFQSFPMPDAATGADLDRLAMRFSGLTRHGVPGDSDEESDANFRRRVLSYTNLAVRHATPIMTYSDPGPDTDAPVVSEFERRHSDHLSGTRCGCGGDKASGSSCCPSCAASLPDYLQ